MLSKTSMLVERNFNIMTAQSAMVRRNVMMTRSTRVFGSKGAAVPEGYSPPSIS